jgi:hypothetical protein
MVVRSERAEFYKSAQHFAIGSIPLKILGLKDSQASQKQGGTDAGKWVFSLEETASARCHVLAVGSEQLREKWLQVLAAAADSKQAAAFMQGFLPSYQEQPLEEHDTTPAAHPLAHAPRSITMDTVPKPHDMEESNEYTGQASAVQTGNFGDEINGSAQGESGEASSTVRADAEDDERATTDTLAKFAQRWKLEAEKMTCLAQSSISAQAETAKEKEALEAELSKMRAQVARARFLEDDSQKTFKEKVAQCQQETQSLKAQLSAQRSEHQKDAEAMERLIAEKDQQLQDKDTALETMSAEILQLNLQLDSSASQVAFDGVRPRLVSCAPRDQSH